MGVVRGFDQASRARAHLVRQSLHDEGVLSADVLAVPAAMHRGDAEREAETLGAHLAGPADGLRLLVDACAATGGEAERLAALLDVPLVTTSERVPAGGAVVVGRPGLAAVMTVQISPNATSADAPPLWSADVALRSLVFSPWNADLSQLQLTVDPHRHVMNVPGALVTMTVAPASIHLRVTDPDGTTQEWRREHVEVQAVRGRCTVIRDDMQTLDLAAGRLVVNHRKDGLTRHVA